MFVLLCSMAAFISPSNARIKRSQSAKVEFKLQYPYLGTGVRGHPSSRLIGVACPPSDDGDR